MRKAYHRDGDVWLYHGDCVEVMREFGPVDAIVTDPPYGLEFMGKEWDKLEPARQRQRWKGSDRKLIGDGSGKGGDLSARLNEMPIHTPKKNPRCLRCGRYRFSGSPCVCDLPRWDYRTREHMVAIQRWHTEWAVEALRVLRPGGHALVFGGTRTFHRATCALEDAGFEIRDCLMWVYGSGFPKSLDVGKAIDRAAGAEREKIPHGEPVKRMIPGADQNETGSWIKDDGREYQPGVEIPATDAAKRWSGWGTALKPAWEPIVLARKPLDGTVARNVQEHGTGALNVDGCRVGEEEMRVTGSDGTFVSRNTSMAGHNTGRVDRGTKTGRWPANVIHDGSDGVLETFPDSGSAARFFYCAKASKGERGEDNDHPTVKPVALMRYLTRLITPPGGLILDPFAGSGSTLVAARGGGFKVVGIEREERYCEIIVERLRKT